jgi:lysine-specific demethylase 8
MQTDRRTEGRTDKRTDRQVAVTQVPTASLPVVNWTCMDRSQYGSHYVKVDVSKKENRLLNSLQMPLSTFLDRYNTSDWYLVDTILPQMAKDIQLPKCLSCGGYRQTVQDIVMWFSSGNTKSSFHFDTVENLNCQISGVKRWFFIDKEEGGLHEAIDHMESDFSGVNVDAVDLYHYPKFQNVSWWSAESHVGDCVYVPYKWFHYVNSVGRNVATNIWWTPFESFNHTDCEANEELKQTTLADMKFTPGSQIRFMMTELIKSNNNKVTFKTANSLFVREHDGTPLMSQETFNILDANNDGLLTEAEVNAMDTGFFEKAIDCKPGEINIHGQHQVDTECVDGKNCLDDNDEEQNLWSSQRGHNDV